MLPVWEYLSLNPMYRIAPVKLELKTERYNFAAKTGIVTEQNRILDILE